MLKKTSLFPSLLLVLAVLFQPALAGGLKEQALKILQAKYPHSAIEYQLQKLPKAHLKWQIQAQQKFFRPQIYRWDLFQKDSLIALAFVDNVMGKEQPITFLAIYSPQGAIIHSEILKYRESIGGAVADPRWQSQFLGKTSQSGFGLNKEIDGISGATISSESLAKGMQKLSQLASYILEKKNVP